MFRVVIIDDEALVRVGLKSMIDWESQDCEIVGEASNGQAGYDLIVDSKPDIVITDIKMPIMDGLEMLQKLLEKNIKTKFIILSSYDEFNLVRKAMKYGIDEYLIKLELEPNILINILSKLKEKIMCDYKKQNDEYIIEKHMRSSKYPIREDFFKKIIGKVIKDEKEIKDEMDYLQIRLTEDNIVCIGIQINDTGKFEKYNEADINLLEFSILNIVDEIVNDFFMGYSFKWTIKEYAIILSNDNNVDEFQFISKIEDMSQRIIIMLKQYFNIDAIIGVSNSYESLKYIGNAYLETCQAVQQSFYDSTKKVIFFKDINLDHNHKKDIDFCKISDSLLKYIEVDDIDAIEITFEDIIDSLNRESISKETVYDICAKITYLIMIAVEKDEKSLQKIFGDNNSIFEKIGKLGSIQDINSWLRALKKGLCNFLASKEKVQNNKIISMVKKFVWENVDKTISLHEVASMMNISPGYLSTIFKQSTGISFVDYVTEVKMEEAKKLLKESNYKIYQIAQMTGYENAYYFSKVFKKITGFTPKEFIVKTN